MKSLQLGSISPTLGMVLKSGTLGWLQDRVDEIIVQLGAKIVGEEYDITKAYVINGVVNSGAGANYIFSSGLIMYNYQFFKVAAATFTTSGAQVPVFTMGTTYLTDSAHDPVMFTDGVSRNIHADISVTIAAGASGSGQWDLSQLYYLNPTPMQVVTVTHAKWSGSSWLKTVKDSTGNVTLHGTLQCIAGATTADIIATMPLNYRPYATLQYSAVKRVNATGLYEPCVVQIASDGKITVYGVNTALAASDVIYIGSYSYYSRP